MLWSAPVNTSRDIPSFEHPPAHQTAASDNQLPPAHPSLLPNILAKCVYFSREGLLAAFEHYGFTLFSCPLVPSGTRGSINAIQSFVLPIICVRRLPVPTVLRRL